MEKKQENKFLAFVSKHKAKITGALGVVGGCVLGCFLAKTASADAFAEGLNAAYGTKADDSVIITDEYDIEYNGQKHRGFAVIDKDPINS